jgi:enoyl-CoA hydratase/carnithine racemase
MSVKLHRCAITMSSDRAAMGSTPVPGDIPALSLDGAIATIRLRRQERVNRIEPVDLETLRQHLQALRGLANSVRALVLTASGRAFSAGYDIGSVLATLQAGAKTDAPPTNAFAELVDELETLPQITVCAFNGGVYGGATDLGLACDFRLGVPQTRLLMPAARLGLHYYPSGLRRYCTRLGLNAAKRLFLLADEVDAQELLRIGYLDEIVAPGELLPRAYDIARQAATMAPLASMGMKANLNAIASGTFDARTCAQAELACLRSADLREGVAAWQERRAPQFTGA